MSSPPDVLKRPYHLARERSRLVALERWASSRKPISTGAKSGRIAFLAGFGNTSYGDTFIGLGTGHVARACGVEPVLIGRSDRGEAFDRAGIEFLSLPDRAQGLEAFEDAAAGFDAIVLAGGGIFEDHVDAVLSQSLAAGYAARLVAAANLGLPTAVHAVGLATPSFLLPRTERLVGKALSTARTVGLRDERGLTAALERFHVEARLVTDPAVIPLAQRQSAPREPNGRAAFIPFGRLAWPFLDRLNDAAHSRQQPDWDATAERLAGFDEVVVVPFHSSDVNFIGRITATIVRRSPKTRVIAAPFVPADPLAAIDVLADCGTAITMRYHGFVASWFAGIRDITTIGSSHKLMVTEELYRNGGLPGLWDPAKAERELQETISAVLG